MSNSNLRRDEAAARKALITVHHYDVAVDIGNAADLSQAGFGTRSTIRFSCTDPGAATFLDFLGPGVESVVLNGESLDVAAVVDDARIHLPRLAAENTVEVTATAAYSRSGEGLHRFVDPADGAVYTYTQYEPADARRVFANFEQPDLKAPFTFSITAPASWEVASNQDLLATTETGNGVSRRDFAPTAPISTYITTILAGPYAKATDSFDWTFPAGSDHAGRPLHVPLAVYCRASLAKHFDADAIFAVTKAGLAYFNELFDYPYPFGKYDQAFVPEYNLGAMENPGLVTFTEAYVFTSRATDTQYQSRANTILHEMAHMWFGDLVTMSWWNDLWLKESFADFMGSLAVAEATGWGPKSWTLFASRRKAWAYSQDQLPTTHPIVADIPTLEAAKQNFDGITYAKGASVLKQLVAYVGRDAFVDGARQYFRDHEYSNTRLADLLTPLHAASGRDLREWAALWLQTSGISVLTPVVESAGGVVTRLSVRQAAVDPVTGAPVPRPHRLNVALYAYDGGALVRVRSAGVDVDGEETVVDELAGAPVPDLVLVNDEDQTYAKVRLDPHSLATALTGLGSMPDPMARSLVWSALWNAVRDGLLETTSYVDAVCAFAAGEDDISVLASLVDNARFAVDRYTPAEARGELRARFVDAVVRSLEAAPGGSDEQLVWARTLAAVGRATADAAPRLRRLLDGTDVPAGLVVDSDLRWLCWEALAAVGQADADELDAELAAEVTAATRASHATALAARPTPPAKAAAWHAAVQDAGLTNELLSATISGFQMAEPALLEPYVEPYFAILTDVWVSRSIGMASRIVGGLFPIAQDLPSGSAPLEHPVVRRTDAWLEENADAAPGLRRIVIEQRDHLLRALMAQQFNSLRESSPSDTL